MNISTAVFWMFIFGWSGNGVRWGLLYVPVYVYSANDNSNSDNWILKQNGTRTGYLCRLNNLRDSSGMQCCATVIDMKKWKYISSNEVAVFSWPQTEPATIKRQPKLTPDIRSIFDDWWIRELRLRAWVTIVSNLLPIERRKARFDQIIAKHPWLKYSHIFSTLSINRNVYKPKTRILPTIWSHDYSVPLFFLSPTTLFILFSHGSCLSVSMYVNLYH